MLNPKRGAFKVPQRHTVKLFLFRASLSFANANAGAEAA
jgi:hypothetical protein